MLFKIHFGVSTSTHTHTHTHTQTSHTTHIRYKSYAAALASALQSTSSHFKADARDVLIAPAGLAFELVHNDSGADLIDPNSRFSCLYVVLLCIVVLS